jgi:Ca-activated chloride channel family protein
LVAPAGDLSCDQDHPAVTFTWPLALWGLLVVPLAVWAHFAVRRRRVRFPVHFTNLDVLAGVVERVPAWRRNLPAALYLLALSVLLLGFARPEATVLVPRESATVVLVMDTSGSMKASDVRPTRLEAAQAAARTFMDQLPERFQVGMVSFADEAQILTQPTVDRAAVRGAIESLTAQGATAMGDALVEALRLNAPRRPPRPSPSPGSPDDRDDPRGKELDAVLLLSDGYNTSGEVEPMEAAVRARDAGVPVFTIALGTPDGVLQAPDAFGQIRSVQVPPDYDTLRAIAGETDAEFFMAPSEEDLRSIYENLGSRIGFVKDKEEVTYAFAGAGLLLAAAGMVLSALWGARVP